MVLRNETNKPEGQEAAPEQKRPEKPEKGKKKEAEKCEQLQKALDEKSDQLLRLAAEYDNFRKRSQREKEELYRSAETEIVGAFLGVLDNFERASENAEAGMEDYKKGIDMIFAQFNEVLEKLGVTKFGEVGEPFDPNIHDAVMHTEDDTLAENTIAQVFAKGYMLNGQLIRPATVQVAN